MSVLERDRHRIHALRQAIWEGAQLSHRAVEIVAVQDAARLLHEPELQIVGRGTEVLAKAAWILNECLLCGEFRSARGFGHGVVRLLEAVDIQAAKRGQPLVLGDPVVLMIAAVVEDFADGGRFRYLDGLASGKPFPPPYLAWNEVQMRTTSLTDKRMEQAERSAYLRAMHTVALQGLERALATHLQTAQRDLWGDVIVCRTWLEETAARSDRTLSEPIPLRGIDGNERCDCATLDRGISVWAPVPS